MVLWRGAAGRGLAGRGLARPGEALHGKARGQLNWLANRIGIPDLWFLYKCFGAARQGGALHGEARRREATINSKGAKNVSGDQQEE